MINFALSIIRFLFLIKDFPNRRSFYKFKRQAIFPYVRDATSLKVLIVIIPTQTSQLFLNFDCCNQVSTVNRTTVKKKQNDELAVRMLITYHFQVGLPSVRAV